ncbi:hypothetical protein J3R83DRAFT_12826 [Lanmaoa asiatica]|nr:hypothetical protein J3R83DRAFT_12826 [Lanmaoa asiatica]
MYIAGLYCLIPSPQGVEGLVVLTTADFLRYLLWKFRASKVTTEGEDALTFPETTPRSLLDKFVFPIQALSALLPPAVYCTAVAFNNFQQPAWMLKFALPGDIVRTEWKTPLRLVACAAGLSLKFAFDRILSHSDERWRMIGRREKPKLTQTGPYAVVRHPMYSVMLLQQVFYSVMYWSYVPLASLGVLAGVFAIKMPIEEKAAQEDDVIGNDYTEYMKRIPARVIPHIW